MVLLRLAPVLMLALLVACATPGGIGEPAPATRAATVDAALAPFEDPAQIPPQIAELPFAPGHAYAILVLLPSPAPVDLSDAERARHALGAFLNPASVWRAGTSVGHAMVGWHCVGGQAGMASKTGDSHGQSFRMLRHGWGIAAFFATYDDGHVYRLAEEPGRHLRTIRNGGARIVAMEIDEAGCQRMRQALAEYMAEPAPVRGHYSLLPSDERPEGDACAGFALWLAGQGGATGGLPPHLMRRLALRESFVGRGHDPGARVVPLETSATNPISLLHLLRGNWHQGAVVAEIDFLDMELFQLSLERAEARAGIAYAPRIPLADPGTAGAVAAAEHWLDQWHRATPVRIGAARAVVLSRG